MKILNKIYHYLFYIYYNLVSKEAGHRAEGASSLLTVLIASIIITIYIFFNIYFGRRNFVPLIEAWGIFILGLVLSILNWYYFIKKRKYLEAINEFSNVPKFFTVLIGVFLLIIPLFLFIFSGIKMGNYIRSLK